MTATRDLWVLRHAKAAASAPGGDHERPLTDRGINQAEALSRHVARLRSKKHKAQRRRLPRLVLSSSAVRAEQTARRVMEGLSAKTRMEVRPDLYLAGVGAVIEVLEEAAAEEESVMVVGHNPTAEDLVSQLSRGDDGALLPPVSLSTCALAHLVLPGSSWGDRLQGSATLVDIFVPQV